MNLPHLHRSPEDNVRKWAHRLHPDDLVANPDQVLGTLEAHQFSPDKVIVMGGSALALHTLTGLEFPRYASDLDLAMSTDEIVRLAQARQTPGGHRLDLRYIYRGYPILTDDPPLDNFCNEVRDGRLELDICSVDFKGLPSIEEYLDRTVEIEGWQVAPIEDVAEGVRKSKKGRRVYQKMAKNAYTLALIEREQARQLTSQ